MSTNSPVVIQQRDGEVITIGPIASTVPGVDWHDATGHTASLVIKADRWAADTTPIVGSITGSTAVGFTASFTVPAAATATHGVKWMHAWVTPPAGEPMTIRYCPLHIEPT